MSASVNKVILIGHLTRDPEIRYTPKGTAVCDIAIAINRKFRLDSGEQKEDVTYVDIVFMSKKAEVVKKWFRKGHPIFVEGRLETDSWEDKETKQKRYKTRVFGEGFQFLKATDANAASDEQSSQEEGQP